MRKYNVENYIRYKNDVEQVNSRLPEDILGDTEAVKVRYLYLVENLARKFSTGQAASGVLDITDLIQEGSYGLIAAANKIDWDTIIDSDNPEKTLISFLSKRIKGAIRRAIDINRAGMRIPEHKLNEMRRNLGEDKKLVAQFFNSIFLSIEEQTENNDMIFQIEDKTEKYNIDLLNSYLKSLMKKYLNRKEYEVLRLSYGLDCDKHSAKQIALILEIKGTSSYVRVSQLKKQAVQRLIDNVDPSQVIDYL
jgi:RNA polymerase sigma factor (sigma-70 family)|tara:strand:+ start:875 stop:1624 length:750 start_codon:yes stop_codon:yes gene_type:complete